MMFHPTSQDNFRVPQPDTVGGKHYCLESRDTGLLNTEGGYTVRYTSLDGGNTSGVRPGSGLAGMSNYHLVNIFCFDAGPLNSSLDSGDSDIDDG